MPWPRRAAPAVALALMVAAVYLPTLKAGFIWDDDAYVTANRALSEPGGLARLWLEPGTTPQYYPMTFTTLWLEHRLWGTDARGYHAANLALHALVCLLLWRLLVRLRVPGAWLAAALFAVHPVMVESVAWVSEIKNLQSATFALLALHAYLRFDPLAPDAPRGNRRWLAASLALFALSLLSKPGAVALPAVIALLLWWRRGRLGVASLRALAPMAALAAASAVVTVLAERSFSGARGAAFDLAALDRIAVAGRAAWFYLRTLVWPAPLVSIYPRWETGQPWQLVFPLALLLAFAMLWALRGRIGRGPLVAAGCYLLLLAPTLGLLDFGYHVYSFVADHFQYHAAPALLALAAAGFAALDRRGSRARTATTAGAALVLLLLGLLAWRHVPVFASERARCEDTVAKNPQAWLAWNNLGVALAAEGRHEDAVGSYRQALRVRPGYAEAHNNLGVALVALDRAPEAAAEYRAALAIWPDYPPARNNLGVALASMGESAAALEQYREAIRLRPGYAEAHANLGAALTALGRTAEAVEHYQEAAKLSPGNARARSDLALALAAAGRGGEAVRHAREALAIGGNDAIVLAALGRALAEAGDAQGAADCLRRALALDPDLAEAHGTLGTVLARLGRPVEALAAFRRDLELRPGSAEAHNNAGSALASMDRFEEAVTEFGEALRLRPDYAEAHVNLGTALASLGRLDDAAAHFAAALRLDARNAHAHNALGVVLARQGRLAAAIAHFESAVAADPADASARDNLARARDLTKRR